ncbi:hypothetical protein LX32DRAFT_71027 [Colletotrichum zoysiae]|uniref:Uncharacterized protein n=1 Tax=Colletotrichum zoysiae TaxID=1216348 RepID=A0AAD9HBH7_9PEZI|nr:hypothetical protein LX32DRAFT_71027 [Colletotrichum zoysiae]
MCRTLPKPPPPYIWGFPESWFSASSAARGPIPQKNDPVIGRPPSSFVSRPLFSSVPCGHWFRVVVSAIRYPFALIGLYRRRPGRQTPPSMAHRNRNTRSPVPPRQDIGFTG